MIAPLMVIQLVETPKEYSLFRCVFLKEATTTKTVKTKKSKLKKMKMMNR